MASQAPTENPGLPILYTDLVPLSSVDHADYQVGPMNDLLHLRHHHAIPLTVEEFASAQRFYPIIFSVGDGPVPLALMALNEGMNTFVDDEGKFTGDAYLPAYVRRYPFMLARLRPDAEELSLCFDPSSSVVGLLDEGEPLFDAGSAERTPALGRVMEFCEQFEGSGQKTAQFMAELAEHKLLIDGEVSIQMDASEKAFVYRGFQMVDEAKLRDLRGDVLRKMMQSGMLPLIHAHLLSLQTMREIFGRQVAQGKMPEVVAG